MKKPGGSDESVDAEADAFKHGAALLETFLGERLGDIEEFSFGVGVEASPEEVLRCGFEAAPVVVVAVKDDFIALVLAGAKVFDQRLGVVARGAVVVVGDDELDAVLDAEAVEGFALFLNQAERAWVEVMKGDDEGAGHGLIFKTSEVVAVKGWVEGEVFEDGVEIDGLGVEGAVFGDFAAIEDFEAVAFKHACAAAGIEGDDLAIDGFGVVLVEVVEEGVDEGAGVGDVAGFGVEVDVEVGDAFGGEGSFFFAALDEPAEVVASGLVVGFPAKEDFKGEDGDVEELIDFISEWESRADEVAFDDAVHFADEGAFGFFIGVVGGEEVGE